MLPLTFAELQYWLSEPLSSQSTSSALGWEGREEAGCCAVFIPDRKMRTVFFFWGAKTHTEVANQLSSCSWLRYPAFTRVPNLSLAPNFLLMQTLQVCAIGSRNWAPAIHERPKLIPGSGYLPGIDRHYGNEQRVGALCHFASQTAI